MAASRRIFRIAVWSGLLASPAICAASPLKFDCDVPADRFASVSQETAGPLAISGTVALILAREGKYLPVAGARLVSSDESRSVGFQLLHPPRTALSSTSSSTSIPAMAPSGIRWVKWICRVRPISASPFPTPAR